MTEMQNTETPTEYVDIKIPALDEDGKPATVGIIASPGEFAGIVVDLTKTSTYECAEITVDQAREMIAALTAAIDCMQPPHTATVNLRITDAEPFLVGELVIRDKSGATVEQHPVDTEDTPEALLAQHGWALEGDWESSSATVRKI